MVKFSGLLVDKSLHGLGTDWRASLIFMTSSITYSLVTLTIHDVTSFLQLMEVQNVNFVNHSFQFKQELQEKSTTLFKMAQS